MKLEAAVAEAPGGAPSTEAAEAALDMLIVKAEAGEKHKLPKQKLGCKLLKLSKLSFEQSWLTGSSFASEQAKLAEQEES